MYKTHTQYKHKHGTHPGIYKQLNCAEIIFIIYGLEKTLESYYKIFILDFRFFNVVYVKKGQGLQTSRFCTFFVQNSIFWVWTPLIYHSNHSKTLQLFKRGELVQFSAQEPSHHGCVYVL